MSVFRNEQQDRHQSKLDEQLRGHGYRTEFVNYSRRKPRQRQCNADNAPPFFLRIPYLNNRLDYAVRKAVKDIGVRVIKSHPQTTLGSLLKPRSSHNEWRVCNFGWCQLKDARCFRTMVVYKAVCNICRLFYIGSTKRLLHQRC